MVLSAIVGSLLTLQAGAAAEPENAPKGAVEETVVQPGEAKVAPPVKTKITDKKHPDYVRCKSESVIGSRAKRKRTCMTNREWALVERRGNEQTAEFMGDNFAAGLY